MYDNHHTTAFGRVLARLCHLNCPGVKKWLPLRGTHTWPTPLTAFPHGISYTPPASLLMGFNTAWLRSSVHLTMCRKLSLQRIRSSGRDQQPLPSKGEVRMQHARMHCGYHSRVGSIIRSPQNSPREGTEGEQKGQMLLCGPLLGLFTEGSAPRNMLFPHHVGLFDVINRPVCRGVPAQEVQWESGMRCLGFWNRRNSVT